MTAAVLAVVPALASQTTAKGVEEPSAVPTLNAAVVQGCFSSPGELVSIGALDFNSKDKCAVQNCKAQGHAVAASMGGNECYCGDKYPPKAALVNDTNCNIGCTGYDWDACGGSFFWTVYNTGLTMAVKVSDDSVISSSSSSSTGTKPTSVATVIESATVTFSASSTATPGKSGGGGTNTAGIAAGVVVGVVAVAGILGGIFFFMRRRRNKELEEKHRRNAAISTFFPGKPPSSSGGYSVSDARLDPVMAQRRVSNGSIADNEDYSRKILRVTNA